MCCIVQNVALARPLTPHLMSSAVTARIQQNLHVSDGKIDYSAGRIDSHCRIVMKNSDSVPQLKCFSYVHHCAARWRHGSHSRHCGHSLLQRQLAALLQCGPAGHGFGGLVQQLQDQSPEPLVWTVEVDSDRAMNRIEWTICDTQSNWIKSFYFLPNRPSLLHVHGFQFNSGP